MRYTESVPNGLVYNFSVIFHTVSIAKQKIIISVYSIYRTNGITNSIDCPDEDRNVYTTFYSLPSLTIMRQ